MKPAASARVPDRDRQLTPFSQNSLVESGQIVGFHGLRGDLKVRPLSGDPTALLAAAEVFLRLPDGGLRRVGPLRQSLHKGLVLLRLEGFETLSAVEGLKGCSILLDREELPALDDDEFYWHQIEGARVVDRRQGEIGRLQSMFSTAAHDTWVVRGARGEVMIPVVEAFVLAIDTDNMLIEVDLPDGLVETAE